MIALNGAATLYSASRDRAVLERTERQLTEPACGGWLILTVEPLNR